MSWPQTIADRQEILWRNFELLHMPFRRQVILEEVADLRLLDFMGRFRSDSYLDSIVAIFFFGLYLCDLTSVELNNRTASKLSPLVVKVRASDLVTENANSLTIAASRLRYLQF